MAADTLGEFYARTKDEDATWPYKMDRQLSYVENRLVCGIKLANWRSTKQRRRIRAARAWAPRSSPSLINGEKVYFAHVGDSRGYRIRGDQIKQMTRDHSLLEDYKEAKPDMSEDEQRNFPHKNVITRALGMRDTVQVDIKHDSIEDGDTFLLCCDGLSGMLEDKKMVEIVKASEGDLEKAVATLVDQANRNGGVDNITVILLTCSAKS